MSLPKPADLLPHRDPFLFVDHITELSPAETIEATWTLTGEEHFFAGHFPGRPTLPGVLMVEAIAQAGAACLLSRSDFAGKLPLFGGVDKVKFRRQVVPGDTLTISVELTRLQARAGKGQGRATVEGELACQADIMFVIVER